MSSRRKGRPRYNNLGWEGVPDDCPAWPDTLEAVWAVRSYDRLYFAAVVAAMVVSILILSVLVVSQYQIIFQAKGLPSALFISIFFGFWARYLSKHQKPTLMMKLVLAPDRLLISSSISNTLAIELPRDQAGWLKARGFSGGWTPQRFEIFDQAGSLVTRLSGRMASVRLENSGDAKIAGGVPIPRQITVATLLGSWWPHPARRSLRAGTVSAITPSPWQDPDLADYAASQRRRHRIAALLLGSLGIISSLEAFFPVAYLGNAILYQIFAIVVGLALLVWSVRSLVWKPDYL